MSNQTIMPKFLIAFCLATLFISSCEYEFVEPEKVIIPDVIGYADDIQPIFDRNCNESGCHVSGFGVLDLSSGNSYEDLFRKDMIDIDEPEQSLLYFKMIEENGTHQGRSNATDQGLVLEWIKKGAKNN